MEIRQLRYFINAAKTLNFTEAAKLSFVVQSTLSQQIKQLEHDVNMQLFDRIGKRVLLTEAGRVFLPIARQIVMDAEYGIQRLQDMEKLQIGNLRIGVTYGLSSILAKSLSQFCQLYPNVRIEIIYKEAVDLLEMLHEREIDFALAFNLLDLDDEIEEMPLFWSELCVVVEQHHRLTEYSKVPFEKLCEYPLIIPSIGMNARRLFNEFVRNRNSNIQPQIEINELYTLLHLVRSGQWVSVLANSIIYEQDGVVAIPFEDASIPMQATLLSPKGIYHRNAIKEYIQTLKHCINKNYKVR